MRDVKECLDLDELLGEKVVLDKLEAARRQLESAIRMFFFDWDVFSQHTLISAAHGIVYDLAKIKGIGGSIKDSTLVPPDGRMILLRPSIFRRTSSNMQIEIAEEK